MKNILFLLACGSLSVARASFPWFETGIADYTEWPADGADYPVLGQGLWTGTVQAQLDRSDEVSRLRVDAPTVAERLEFAPAVSKAITDGTQIYTVAVCFPIDDGLPEIDEAMKFGVTVSQREGTPQYYGLVYDAEAGAPEWLPLVGATPDPERTVTLTMTVRQEANGETVQYAIDGAVLSREGTDWQPLGSLDELVGAVGFTGMGEVAALSAAVESTEPVRMVELTLPVLAHVNVKRVTIAGVEVRPNADGVYVVEAGSVVTVTFAPEAGWALDVSTMTFVVRDAMTLPENGRPVPQDVKSFVIINEIMAKNGETIRTKKGYEGLDWIELKNTGTNTVDLTGYYCHNDPTAKKSKWQKIQGSCVIPPGGYKIVWCDKDLECPDEGFDADEAFVRFNITTDSNSGKELFLADQDGKIFNRLPLPGGIKDISYGLGRLSRTLVSRTAAAEYRIGDGAWKPVDGSVGMSATATGFTVVSYKSNVKLSNMDTAESCVAKPTMWSVDPVTNTVAALAFAGNLSVGAFPSGSYSVFPGYSSDDMVVVATGSVLIPEAGPWSFAVGSDDGFTAKLSRLGKSWSWESRGTRGYAHSVATFTLEPGAYEVELVYFNRSNNRLLDFSAAKGRIDSEDFSPDTFSLVGLPGSAVVHAGALGSQVSADVTDEMKGQSPTLTWRTTFALDETPQAADVFRLMMRYADGFVATLNGETIASAPVTGARSAAEALTPVVFTIHATQVRKGDNALEIVATNDAIDDGEFFLSPELVWDVADDLFVYSTTPTPGAPNAADGKTGFTPVVTFSEPHGYKDAPFTLTLSCAENPTAVIYYTLDGTSPRVGAEGTFRYAEPLAIDRTTVIRAAVPDVDSIFQQDVSATYLFYEDIITQSSTPPAGFPANKAVNGQEIRYGMRAITGDDAERLKRGFTQSIRTVSFVVDPKHLFDGASGIYVNATGNGRGWERPTMVEQINPLDPTDEFSVAAGLRIRGAASRKTNHPKHSFRLFFRSEYGMGTLKHALFGSEGTDKFEKIDFRTSQNYAWANGIDDDTFIHETFSRDSQRDMGEPYNRSRYYNLFINGVYWGLYQTEERVDQNYCEEYAGGKGSNYDVVRTSQPGYNTGVVEGETDAWETLWRISTQEGYGEGHEANYNRVRGLNPDGTRNLEYPILLNVTNLVNYMITAHFTGDADCPANSSGMANNLIAYRNRVEGDGGAEGFRWNRHDAEHSMGLGANGGASNVPSLIYGTREQKLSNTQLGNFNAAELHYELSFNAEYCQTFADLVYKHMLKTGGAMTAVECEKRFRARMAEIDDAIVCESARWGNADKRTRKRWLNTNCENRIKFINARTAPLLAEYRRRGWYPSFDVAAVVDEKGEPLVDGAKLPANGRVTLTGIEGGTIYYTLDGTDPRLPGGAVSPAARAYKESLKIPCSGVTLAVRVLKDGEWSVVETVNVTREPFPGLTIRIQ